MHASLQDVALDVVVGKVDGNERDGASAAVTNGSMDIHMHTCCSCHCTCQNCLKDVFLNVENFKGLN